MANTKPPRLMSIAAIAAQAAKPVHAARVAAAQLDIEPAAHRVHSLFTPDQANAIINELKSPTHKGEDRE